MLLGIGQASDRTRGDQGPEARMRGRVNVASRVPQPCFTMLHLANLRNLLSQVLALPELHTAVLFTPEGQLVSYAADPYKPKDHVRVLVGLSGEIWQETKEHGIGMADSELGRLLIMPIERIDESTLNGAEEHDPVMLLTLNADNSVSWEELEIKATELARHLGKPLLEMGGRLAVAPPLLAGPRPERVAR